MPKTTSKTTKKVKANIGAKARSDAEDSEASQHSDNSLLRRQKKGKKRPASASDNDSGKDSDEMPKNKKDKKSTKIPQAEWSLEERKMFAEKLIELRL